MNVFLAEMKIIIGDVEPMSETARYIENQYYNGELVLIAQCTYELNFDTLNNRYFVINQNNELIYLDEIKSVAIVQISTNIAVITSFFVI